MIHHGGTETRRKLILEDLTQEIIGAAIEVHRELGPGLLESACEECLCHELHLRGLSFERQVSLPVQYKVLSLIVVTAWTWLLRMPSLELKSVEKILPVHE